MKPFIVGMAWGVPLGAAAVTWPRFTLVAIGVGLGCIALFALLIAPLLAAAASTQERDEN